MEEVERIRTNIGHIRVDSRDAYTEVGGRATQEAKAEGIGRVESGSAKPALGVRRPRKCQKARSLPGGVHIFQQLPTRRLE